ncbi:MAG: hypothetical protein RCG15_08395 [Candidatus Rickettsia vulgarisii]
MDKGTVVNYKEDDPVARYMRVATVEQFFSDQNTIAQLTDQQKDERKEQFRKDFLENREYVPAANYSLDPIAPEQEVSIEQEQQPPLSRQDSGIVMNQNQQSNQQEEAVDSISFPDQSLISQQLENPFLLPKKK